MNDTERPHENRRMRFPDGLRAVAAMLVILPHAAGLFAYWSSRSVITGTLLKAAPFGACGVQIFFVLSGFVIAYTLRGALLSPGYIGNFILRRSIRLDPPYWAAIALFCCVIAFRRHAGHELVPYPSSAQLLAHVFYAQDILGYGDINVVFWTLCIEIQFYLVFCLLLWLFQVLEWGRIPLLALFTLSLAWPAHLISTPLYPGSFLPHWYGFLAGAIVWWTAGRELPRWAGYCAVVATWLVAAIAKNAAPITVALTASLLLTSSHRGSLYRWLDTPAIQFLGRLSYCIYLVHVPISILLLGALVRQAPSHEFVSYVFFATLIALTVGAAYVLHRLVEIPALRWSRRFKPAVPKPASVHNFAQTGTTRAGV